MALSGTANSVERFSKISGSAYRGTGSVSTSERTLFRVDSRPVLYQSTPSVTDGDRVTVVGSGKKATFNAIAMRNHTTGCTYLPYSELPVILIVFFAGGAVLVSSLFGSFEALLQLSLSAVGSSIAEAAFGGLLILLAYSRWHRRQTINRLLNGDSYRV